ncbi:mitochondrial inner membrane protein OXA1L [Synchiropus splendidus]|uniref:mitochondrial inner membrane protein OXA1L n=1 Tax=Synchiropus splendidus TaxID=270530 RepID=UPI00237D4FED|nr:mitochondrial inner membrane protein OXA1L [Synchiropus splendidus]
MAAIRSGVTPICITRCLLRGKHASNRQGLSHMQSNRLIQCSHLHTMFESTSRGTRTLLGGRQQGKLLWVNAVTVRQNSSQVPSEGGFMVATDSPRPPDAQQVLTPADPAPILAQPLTEKMTVETVSTAASTPVDVTPPVMEPVLDAATTAAEVLQAVEPRLTELGLGAYTPVGLIQNILEFFHMDLGLPWWAAIVTGTVLARLAVFPVIVKGQREAAKLNNVMPEMTKLTTKMNEAKQSGNKFEFAKAYTDLNTFQKKHDVNPLRGFLVPMAQMPVFISFFVGLRKMAYLPVPSLQTGGALWFTDLTAADPYFLLPIAVTGSMFLILELGAESGIDNPNLRAMKAVFRIMPFVILPLTINFPTAVFTYWLTSNCFSLCQVALLRNPTVRQKLRIPERIIHPPSALPQTEGFFASMKSGWKNAQLAQQLEERDRRIKNHLDLAAKGPLRQTFTHNPVQQTPPISAASAKDKGSKKAQQWRDTLG